MRLIRLLPLLALAGCAPSLRPRLDRLEIPAQRPRPLVLLPLEDRNVVVGSQDSYADAERSVRQILTERLAERGVEVVPVATVDSLVERMRLDTRSSWTRAQAAELADSLGARYVLFGSLKAYLRGRKVGRSTQLAWSLELMDARTQHPLSRIGIDLRGGQDDPFRLLVESGKESAEAILKAWEDCPER